jgi:thioredoxin-like negative regulator of GroEL
MKLMQPRVLAFPVALVAAALAGSWFLTDWPARRAARRAVTAERWTEAERLIRPLIERHPNDAELRLWMGSVATERGRFAEALNHFEDVPEGSRWGEEALVRSARIQLAMKHPAQAEVTLRRVLRTHPASTDARKTLVQMYHLERRLLEAKEILWELYELVRAPDRIDVLGTMFRVDFGRASPVDGEVLQAFLRESPTDPHIVIAVAEDLMISGQLEEARDRLVDAQSKYPRHVNLCATLAELYRTMGELEQAEEMLRDVPDQFQTTEYRRQAGIIQQELHNNPDEAIKCYMSVLAVQPDDWNTRHRLALTLLAAGRTDLGTDELARVDQAKQLLDGGRLTHMLNDVLSHLDNVRNRLQIAEHYRRLGMSRECRAWYVAALDLDPKNELAQQSLDELSSHEDAAGGPKIE